MSSGNTRVSPTTLTQPNPFLEFTVVPSFKGPGPGEFSVYQIDPSIIGADGDWGHFSINGKKYQVDRVFIHAPGYHRLKGKQYAAEVHFQGFNGGDSATYVVFMQRDDLADDNPLF